MIELNNNIFESFFKEKNSTFYEVTKILPKKLKYAIWVIYTICRLGDDAADEKDSIFTIEEWKNWVFPVWEGVLINEYSTGLKWLIEEYHVEKYLFEDLLKGFVDDINNTKIKTLDDLDKYCYYVAGTVSLMICKVLNVKNQEYTKKAVEYAKFLQLCNIIRDIEKDYENNRFYIPLEIIKKPDNKELLKTKEYMDAKKILIKLAKKSFRESVTYLNKLPVRFRIAAFLAGIKHYRWLI